MDWIPFIRWILAAGVVLLLPGAALLAWLPRDSSRQGAASRDPVAWLADAAALSCAVTAVGGLWLFVAGWRVGAPVVIAVYAACLLALGVAAIRHSFRWPAPRQWLPAIFALAFIAVLVAWRLYQARGLALPAWTDSVQHALIVRKILEYGGVPPDLSPYLAVPFYYHFDFHLITALFAFVSGLSPDQAVLWFGQVINAFVSISVYRAALAFQEALPGPEDGRQPGLPAAWTAALAALLVEFALQMPAYYLTWGRYTLLTGLVLLGPALAAAVEIGRGVRRWDAWARLALLVAGAFLAHYFVLLLIGLFLIVLGLFWLIRGARAARGFGAAERTVILRLVSAALAGILLALPWVIRVFIYSRQNATVAVVSPLDQTDAALKSAADYLLYLSYLLGPRRNHILLALSGVGLLFALWHPSWRVLAAWAAVLALLALPWGLRLGPFRPDHFAIVLFFPAALLLAALLTDGAGALGRLLRPWAGRAVLLAVAGIILWWGAWGTRDILNPSTIFTTSADVAALDWVNRNTPPTARFYINSTFWQWNVYRGVDGGYWLEPYTGRASLIPPIQYAWGTAAYIQQINDWAVRSEALRGCTADFWNLVQEAGLSYVYIREGQGNLQPPALTGCSQMRLVYQQNGVFIYEILAP